MSPQAFLLWLNSCETAEKNRVFKKVTEKLNLTSQSQFTKTSEMCRKVVWKAGREIFGAKNCCLQVRIVLKVQCVEVGGILAKQKQWKLDIMFINVCEVH